jgi:hypothetical protein
MAFRKKPAMRRLFYSGGPESTSLREERKIKMDSGFRPAASPGMTSGLSAAHPTPDS